MKKIFLLIMIVCCLHVSAQSKQTDTHLHGHVLDAKTQEHLPFINIFLKNTTIGTNTDATGHYYMKNLPTGKFTIVVKGIGYKTIEKEIDLKESVSAELNFEIEEEAFSLNEMVVSANRNETNRKDAAVVVGVLNPAMFEASNSVCLSQGLNFQTGVRMENNCQNCGYFQARINGLEGPYSQILIDSRPIFSALGGVYGLEQIPVNMVERVEVVRGGGSALYGANAIAGTINVITKEPVNNSFSAGYNLELIDGKTPDNVVNVNTSLVTGDKKAGMYLYGSYRNRGDFDYDKDGFTEIPVLRNNSLGMRAYYKLSTYSKLSLEYHNLNEFRRGGNALELPPHEADIAEQVDNDINGGGISYNWFSPDGKNKLNTYVSMQHVKRKSYYGVGQDPDAYGNTKNLTGIVGAQYMHAFDNLLFMPSELTTGLEYQYDELDDEILSYRDEPLHQKTHVLGYFLQNEWKNTRWNFLIGARLDKHNLLDDLVISPRANIKYNILRDLHWRASYSAGFRAPQTFEEDLHISFLNGEGLMTHNADGLKPEYSNSVSTSFDYYMDFGKVQANLLVEGFYTRINDVFVIVPTEDALGNAINERRNGHDANVMGINMEGKIAPSRQLQLQFGYTFQKSEYSELQDWVDDGSVPPEKKMLRTPNQYGYLTLTAEPVKKLQLALTGTYTGKMFVPHAKGYISENRLEKTPHFFDVNFKASYDFKISGGIIMQVSAGVKNIFNQFQDDFDKGSDRDSGYIYGPALPRTAFFSVKFNNIF